MLSENMLSEVFSYLTLQDLQQILKVNRKFRKIGSSPLYYKREFTRIYMTGTDSYLTISPNWLYLCLNLLKQEKIFCSLSTNLSNNSNLSAIYKKLTDILAVPEIPLPKLRKDILTYPTPVQDILANINDPQPEPNDFFLQQFKFIETDIFSNTEKFLNSFLRPVSLVFLKVVGFFCEGCLLKIEESQDFFETYLESWEQFSLSIQNMNEFVLLLIEDIRSLAEHMECNEVYSLFNNFHGFMVNIWKEKVLNALQEKLNNEFVEHLACLFVSGEEGIDWLLCKRFTEAMFDVSIDEFSVHFKNHSMSALDGPIKVLEGRVSEYFEGKRIHNEKDFDKLDLVLRIFPSMINRKIVEKLNLQIGWPSDYEQYIHHMQTQDYLVEYMAKGIGISYSDVGFFSRCKNIELVDLLTHVREFKEDVCN